MLWKSATVSAPRAELCIEDHRMADDDTGDALDAIALNDVKLGNISLLEWARVNGCMCDRRHFGRLAKVAKSESSNGPRQKILINIHQEQL